AFSPVFKPHKAGNVVNMGNINAQNVTLQGNKVMLSADTSWDDKNNKIKFNQITADNIDLQGNEVYMDISTINSKNLTTEAKNKGIAYLSATGYYYNPTRKYNDIVFTNKGVMDKTYNQYISIGSDVDWWHFAKGWNEKDDFRNNVVGDTFKLTNDIDFKASGGQNYANYWVDLNGDGKRQDNEFTNMIVGFTDNSAFTKIFDGQGFTLKNINIDTTGFFYPGTYPDEYVGIFGISDGAKFKNINIDYMGGSVKAYGYGDDGEYTYISKYAGGFAGSIEDSEIDNISLKNLAYITAGSDKSKIGSIYLGGFVGEIKKTNTSNVVLKDIGTIEAVGNAVSVTGMSAGGFAGRISGGREFMYIKDIALENIDNIIAINTAGGSQTLSAGGFAGAIDSMAKDGYISHVKLNNINNIKSGSEDKIDGNIDAGGFVGRVEASENFNIKDIVVKNINHIYTGKSDLFESNSGGFAGTTFLNGWENVFFRNIYIENIGDITSNANSGGFIGSNSYGETNYVDITVKNIDNIQSTRNSGGFVGFNRGGNYSKIYIGDIKNISSKRSDNLSNSFNYAGGFIGFNGYGEFSDITVKNIGNISSISDGFTYSGGFIGGFDSGEFKRISLENITNINSTSKSNSSYSGGFAGGSVYNNPYASFYFADIYLKDVLNISSYGEISMSGGFAGEIVNTREDNSIVFDRISINNINNIEAKGEYYAVSGGFFGLHSSFSIINDIKLSNVNEIKVESLGVGSSGSAGGFAGEISRDSKFENIILNNFGNIIGEEYTGGFVGEMSSDLYNPNEFNNIVLNNFGNIIGEEYTGGFVGVDTRTKMSNISLNNIDYIQGNYTGGFAGKGQGDYRNIALNNIKHIKGKYAGGFTVFGTGGKNIYIYFDKGAIIEGSESSGKFFGYLDEYFLPNAENTYIYHYKKDLTSATADQKYWGNEIQLHPYDDNSQGYIDFKTAALAALNGLKEIDCGASKKCLVFTKDFEIEKPSNPNISESNYPNNVIVSKPSQNTDYIPNTEEIINEKVVLDENDLYKDIIINEIIADLKNKYYTIDIADLKAILEAYKNLDKNSAEARTKFIMDYFFDKNNKDNPSMEIARKEIFQSLDFLLAYQDNGLNKAGDDKFASKETIQVKNDILTEVSNSLENKTIASNLENLSNLND
ncbi:hypothetical protein L8X36_07970, partial [Campylobacter sp. CNRCH_2014_0184h]|nr:hypothetical protein [Campylobacter sp. CNRCH_2014_0184h]